VLRAFGNLAGGGVLRHSTKGETIRHFHNFPPHQHLSAFVDADVVVIDRANHNLFQPLLYQAATTVLSPAQIASPIRGLLKNRRNTTVFLGEVSGINKDAKFVYASNEDHDRGTRS